MSATIREVTLGKFKELKSRLEASREQDEHFKIALSIALSRDCEDRKKWIDLLRDAAFIDGYHAGVATVVMKLGELVESFPDDVKTRFNEAASKIQVVK